MWIEELPNGKYKFVERYEDPLTGKQRKVSLTNTKKTKKVQKEMFQKLQSKIEKKLLSTNVKESNITFEQLIDNWMKLKSQQVKGSTLINIETRNNVINAALGKYIVNKMPDNLFNVFFLSLQNERNLVYSTVNQYRIHIEQVLEYGRIYEGITIHPNLTVQRLNVSTKDDFKYLEKEELASVVDQLEALGDLETARYVQIQSLTGMRSGELSAINYKEDIDWESKTISITKTYFSRGRTFQTPKTGKPRIISVNDETLRLLKEQIIATKLKMMSSNIPRDMTYLFLTRNGNPCSIEVWSRRLSKVDVPGKKITTHIFRHTFITRMVEAGVDTKLIAEHVGHSNTQMIEKVYSHFTNLMNERLTHAINEVEII
ncbi:tyrosine-type recombinase/integrase [Hutsoniella sourekii]|uniref:tyrosine-type recombinase/integrase n=1 Tax=Hutsoniella sourekii TaxID=87650 RepID=UPI000487A886|nr:site-specific integrase [Hutsoniella sourekii]